MKAKGWIAGEPVRFVKGHNRRIPRAWTVEDRGYLTPCHIWQNGRTGSGYGAVRVGDRTRPAHLVIWQELNGPKPTPHLDHLCRVLLCVNPEHLEPVTVAGNTRRGLSTKLTLEDALTIRDRRAAGERGSDLAREYAISPQQVCGIHKRRSWTADLEGSHA